MSRKSQEEFRECPALGCRDVGATTGVVTVAAVAAAAAVPFINSGTRTIEPGLALNATKLEPAFDVQLFGALSEDDPVATADVD